MSTPAPGTEPQSCIKSQTGRGEDDPAGMTLPTFPPLVPQLLWSLCMAVRHQPRAVLSLARAESVLVLPTLYGATKHHHDPCQLQFLPLQGQEASLKAHVSPLGNILWRTKSDVKEQEGLSSGRCPDLGRRKAL